MSIIKLSAIHKSAALKVINDAAGAYEGVIPPDRWKEPYMSAEEFADEIHAGVRFYGWIRGRALLGIAGIQHFPDVDLIRHCYVSAAFQRRGIGTSLLKHLLSLAQASEVLVGTWEDAMGAIRFYERHGFERVSREEKDNLLSTYWNIPRRQIETSVVLRRKK